MRNLWLPSPTEGAFRRRDITVAVLTLDGNTPVTSVTLLTRRAHQIAARRTRRMLLSS